MDVVKLTRDIGRFPTALCTRGASSVQSLRSDFRNRTSGHFDRLPPRAVAFVAPHKAKPERALNSF